MRSYTSSPPAATKSRKSQSYESSPIKRNRRTRATINKLCDQLFTIVWECRPATIRQVYYRAVSAGVIPKTEAAYKDLCRLLGIMRRDGRVPFGWLVDNTRLMRKPLTHSSIESCLENTAQAYRRALWDDQDAYVEIWSEKDAISGVIVDITRRWDVPLMISRGFASLSFLHSAAEQIAAINKPTFLYYFGDHDPSGVTIDRTIESNLREFAPDADITFQRVAVTVEQIEELELPTRPTKKTDSRSKSFRGESVEVDAIPPDTLRSMVTDVITQHIDSTTYERTLAVERAERETLRHVVESLGGAA